MHKKAISKAKNINRLSPKSGLDIQEEINSINSLSKQRLQVFGMILEVRKRLLIMGIKASELRQSLRRFLKRYYAAQRHEQSSNFHGGRFEGEPSEIVPEQENGMSEFLQKAFKDLYEIDAKLQDNLRELDQINKERAYLKQSQHENWRGLINKHCNDIVDALNKCGIDLSKERITDLKERLATRMKSSDVIEKMKKSDALPKGKNESEDTMIEKQAALKWAVVNEVLLHNVIKDYLKDKGQTENLNKTATQHVKTLKPILSTHRVEYNDRIQDDQNDLQILTDKITELKNNVYKLEKLLVKEEKGSVEGFEKVSQNIPKFNPQATYSDCRRSVRDEEDHDYSRNSAPDPFSLDIPTLVK